MRNDIKVLVKLLFRVCRLQHPCMIVLCTGWAKKVSLLIFAITLFTARLPANFRNFWHIYTTVDNVIGPKFIKLT